MTDHELEDRLRRTYAAVADATRAAPPGTAETATPLIPASPDRNRRPWRTVAVAAAALIVLTGGLVIISGRNTSAPAGPGALVHVLPGYLPVPLDAVSGSRATPSAVAPLRSIESSPTRDRLVYSSDSTSLTITVLRTGGEAASGEPVELPLGTGRMATGTDTSRLTLAFGDGAVAVLETRGEFVDEWGDGDPIVAVARHLVMVDASEWERATEAGGFRTESSIGVHEVGGTTLEIVGNIHEGITILTTYGAGFLPGRVSPDCITYRPPEGLLAIGPPGTRRARVSTGDGKATEVELENFRDAIAVALIDDGAVDRDVIQPDCEVVR